MSGKRGGMTGNEDNWPEFLGDNSSAQLTLIACLAVIVIVENAILDLKLCLLEEVKQNGFI